jgi:hypothetical protein
MPLWPAGAGLIGDREVIGCVLADVAGDAAASANEAATA